MRTLFCLILCSLYFATTAVAQQMYRYQDEQGRWHFTDRPPADGRQAETRQLRSAANDRNVVIKQVGDAAEPLIHIVNRLHGPVEVELSLAESINVSSHPELPRRLVVPGASEIRALSLRAAQPGQPWRFQLQHRAMIGDPDANHRPPRPYAVPFRSAQSFPITQGFNGTFSHNTPASQYAVDIGMPEGTDIVAAREGIVMDVTSDSFSGGTEERHREEGNMIRILHDDGTMAVYGHLRLDSARVRPGTRVDRGQVIARSGNTGFSTAPHLHFVIQKNAGFRLISVPFEFEGSDGRGFTPEVRMLLTAR